MIEQESAVSFDYRSSGFQESFLGPGEELRALANAVGLVPRYPMDIVTLHGRDSLDLLHRISTNDLLSPKGAVTPTILVNEKGRIIDYVRVVPSGDETLLLCSPGMGETVASWVEKFIIMEDVAVDPPAGRSVVTLVGPDAADTARRCFPCTDGATGVVVVHGENVRWAITTDFGIEAVHFISARPDTVASSFPRETAGIGWRAWEIYRIAHGMPLTGREITPAFNPFDCGLLHAVSFSKGCYIGQEVIARIDTYQKARRSLYGVRTESDPGTTPLPASVLKNDEEVGVLTSVCGTEEGGVGLAVLRSDQCTTGDIVATADVPSFQVSGFPISLSRQEQ